MSNYLDKFVVVFIDNILIYLNNKQEHEEHLRIILQVLREQQLFAKFCKCDFFKDIIQYLGHIVFKDGISVDPNKIKTMYEWQVSKKLNDIRSFMGITGYYQNFIEGFPKIAYPITSLQKKGKKFDWREKCIGSFNKLKHLLTTAPILKTLDHFKDFVICTNACKEGLDEVLIQENYVIAY